MTIQRATHDKQNPYFQIVRGVAQNKTISYEALGMLTYLLSKPDDWKIIPEDLKRTGCGRDKVYKLLKELETAGHIILKRQEAAQGLPPMWGERTVIEQPFTENQETVTISPEKPDTVKAGYGKTAPTYTDKQQKKDQNARAKAFINGAPKHECIEICEAWANSQPIYPIYPYSQKNLETAAEIWKAGYRATQVSIGVKEILSDDWWIGKTLTLLKVAEVLPAALIAVARERDKQAQSVAVFDDGLVPDEWDVTSGLRLVAQAGGA